MDNKMQKNKSQQGTEIKRNPLLITLALLLISSVSYGQELKQPIDLIIKSDKPVYELGEEIWIDGFMVNTSDDARDIKPLLPGVAEQSFGINVSDGERNGEIFPWFGQEAEMMKQAWLIKTTEKLESKKSLKAFRLKINDFSFFSRPHLYAYPFSEFMRPGIYKVNWKINQIDGINGISNTILIDLVESRSKSSVPTDRDYETTARRICEKVMALGEKYPILKTMNYYEPPNERGEGRLYFEHGVHRIPPKPTNRPSKQGMIITYDPGGLLFGLHFYRGQWGGQVAVLPYEFGDLKLWYYFDSDGERKIIDEITNIIYKEIHEFNSKFWGTHK